MDPVTDTPTDTVTDSVTDTANDAVTNTVIDTVSDKGLGLQGCFIDTWIENKRNKKDMKRTTENDMVSQTDSGTCDSPQHDSCPSPITPITPVTDDVEDGEDGYTFPACQPVKRIDYVLFRNSPVPYRRSEASNNHCNSQRSGDSICDNGWRGTVLDSKRVGIAPTPSTGKSTGFLRNIYKRIHIHICIRFLILCRI